jgi:hypothetical protein
VYDENTPPIRFTRSSLQLETGCEVVKQNEKVLLGWPVVGVIVFYIPWLDPIPII